MDKKELTHKEYDLLHREMGHLEKSQIISEEEKERILGAYSVKEGLSFLQISLTIGALLLGIGILSFVASNWMYLGKPIKITLIIGLYIAFNVAGVMLRSHYPKTARSLHYAGILTFGAGIFLIEQMFNLQINFNTSFLLWATGTVVIGYYLKDLVLLVFTSFLLFFYLNGSISFDGVSYPLAILVFLPVMYFILKKFEFPKLLAFFLNALTINTIALFLFEFLPKTGVREPFTLSALILFVLGIGLTFLPVIPKMQKIVHVQGQLLHGAAGLYLTFQYSILFAVAYLLFLLYYVYKGSLSSIAIICVLILRYYIDYSFDFLPKSLTFIIGGIILISFGFLFEKQRKKEEEKNEKS